MKTAKQVARREKVREIIVSAAAMSDVAVRFLKACDAPETEMTEKDLNGYWKRIEKNYEWLSKAFSCE